MYSYRELKNAMRNDSKGRESNLDDILSHPELIDFGYRSESGRNLLFKACKYSIKCVKFFLNYFSPNEFDSNRCTILYPIVFRGTLEMLEHVLPLMSSEAINRTDVYGKNVLHIAYINKRSFIPLLLEYSTPEAREHTNDIGCTYDNLVRKKPHQRSKETPFNKQCQAEFLRMKRNPFSHLPRDPEVAHVVTMMMTLDGIERCKMELQKLKDEKRVKESKLLSEEARNASLKEIAFQHECCKTFANLPDDVTEFRREITEEETPKDPAVAKMIFAMLLVKMRENGILREKSIEEIIEEEEFVTDELTQAEIDRMNSLD